MRKAIAALILAGSCLWAADFWQSKPYTEWGDRDLQKMMTNSPWARALSAPANSPEPAIFGSGRGDGPPDPISAKGTGGIAANEGGTAADVVTRWQSALPIREAPVRVKYGVHATTSAEARQILEREEKNYVIVLSGPAAVLLHGTAHALEMALVNVSVLSVRGKAIKPDDVEVSANRTTVEVLFVFPRSMPFTPDDKEVEFSTRAGTVDLRYRFRLKDMVFQGKLEL